MKEKGDSLESRGDVSNVLVILQEAKRALKKGDALYLSALSDRTMHSATVVQDSLNIIVAVFMYALSKIMQRKNYQSMEGWSEFYTQLMVNLDLMITDLQKGDSEQMIVHAGRIREALNTIESDLGLYITDVFHKAEINKAFKLYDHGLSSEKTANLLGISLWELASYIGQSSVSEAKVNDTLSEQDRITYMEEFFG